jgi:signal transduction histidine kinase
MPESEQVHGAAPIAPTETFNGASPRPRSAWRACGLGWLAAVCLGFCSNAPAIEDNVYLETPPAVDLRLGAVLDPEWGVGAWIWDSQTRDKQTVRFWRAFDIPRGATVTRAKIHICVDNGYRLMLDDRELGTGSDWRSITEYDVSLLLGPGRHTLGVEAFNDNREAGMLFGMTIETTDGRVIEIPSDARWRIAPAGEQGWQKMKEVPAKWGNALIVSPFLPREGHWHQRVPTMTVKVPVLRPLERHFWQSGWFQAALWSVVCITGLLYLRVLAKFTLQSRAQAMLHTERARIARDIHDELGARLTELALEGEVAQTELPEGSPVQPRLEALCEKARAVSSAMDELVWMVNSRRDTLRDFTNFACKHAQRFLSQTAIRCRLDVDGNLPDVTFELPMRRNLLLGVKEALNNAVKYSEATEIQLGIHRRNHSLFVTVDDNGKGFDLEQIDASRNGLANMVERMKEVGGMCRISSQPGAGCRVEFQIPLPRNPSQFAAPPAAGNPSLASIRASSDVKQITKS